ncbi:MAG: ATP-dependent DNA ligase [Nitrospirales bacterium]|nr:MAG: ATP-dependent DNA ligase [Nitrospirales bacterium]
MIQAASNRMRHLSHCARLELNACLSLTLLFVGVVLWSVAEAKDKPAVMLAEVYQPGIDVSQYWVSEKLDGVRARWDGHRLISRGGHAFAAPTWFTAGLPNISLDGELWIARGRYEETSSIVRKLTPHEGWRDIRLMLFDLPEHDGTFDQRVSAMKRLVEHTHSPFLVMIEQQTIQNEEELQQRLTEVLDQGGEGLMLHRKTARYASGRTHDVLKLKPFMDAEATVIGYRPGKGQFAGQVGSLKVRTDEGVELYIGSGLSNAQRRHPPPVQSRITFRYQGLTKNGVPRFPVFLRIRHEQPE